MSSDDTLVFDVEACCDAIVADVMGCFGKEDGDTGSNNDDNDEPCEASTHSKGRFFSRRLFPIQYSISIRSSLKTSTHLFGRLLYNTRFTFLRVFKMLALSELTRCSEKAAGVGVGVGVGKRRNMPTLNKRPIHRATTGAMLAQ